MKNYDVYAVGHALVDIQARVSEETLAATGFAKGIMTLVDEAAQLRVLAALEAASITRCAGGSAANTIMAVADFGGRSAFAGKVAGDDLGEFFLRDMRAGKVAIEVPPSLGHTGTSVILITEDAQRTMLTHLGVSSTLGPDDIHEAEIRQAKYIYIEGYLFTADATRAAAMKAIDIANKNGVKVAFTVSDPFLINLFREQFWGLIESSVDLLFCNLEEARSLTEKTDPIHCAQAIHTHCENVVLTLGADGAILMHEQQAIPIEGVAVEAIDTTGAGDMFAGGILYGINNGMTWKQAGHLATHAASRIVAQLGARLHRRFTTDEIRAFLA